MKEELIQFIIQNNLSPFSNSKTSINSPKNSIFNTRDAKSVHQRVLSVLSSEFNFKDTSNIWNFFDFNQEFSEIEKRQEFFKSLTPNSNNFLEEILKPKPSWHPPYETIVVTENESTFVEINGLNCSTQMLISDNDLLDLEKYDLVQVIDCDNFHMLLERLPQTVFINSIENVYLERHLEKLSGWKDNLELIRGNSKSEELITLIDNLKPLFELINQKKEKALSEEEAENRLEEINQEISSELKKLTISGESLIAMLGNGKMPDQILNIIKQSISKKGLSEEIFNLQFPLTIDYNELRDKIKRQNNNQFTNFSERVKSHSKELKEVPKILQRISALILLEDFSTGISNYIKGNYPKLSNNFSLINSKNIFLDNPQPISFNLDEKFSCSILTGANSGGKTTLIEHIIQSISLFYFGLPVDGESSIPLFSDIYYFAKNKGSASKGAFETLLTQMSNIKPGRNTLILADEIEAVTEPGVAGKIISATADYFIKKNCFIVLATHLGYEIKKSLPVGARIDGIEAKGLDESFNLIVDHNPVLGRLAHSTPELIVERMANFYQDDYFKHLFNSLKQQEII